MRAAWICVLLLILIISCTTLNAFYIHRQSELLSDLANKLQDSDEREATLSQLQSAWNKHQTRFSLSIGFRELDHFNEILVGLQWANESKNEQEFQRYRLLLLNAIEDLTRAERLHVKNIF